MYLRRQALEEVPVSGWFVRAPYGESSWRHSRWKEVAIVHTAVEPSEVDGSSHSQLSGTVQNFLRAAVGTGLQEETDIEDIQGPFIAGSEGDCTVEPREQSGMQCGGNKAQRPETTWWQLTHR